MLNLGDQMTEKIPLRRDSDGTVRVGDTRVTLDVLMEAYDQGATPEQIVQKFGELRLDEVYAVITYYLRHSEEIRTYLAERSVEAEALQKEIQAKLPNSEFRKRLLRMRNDRESGPAR